MPRYIVKDYLHCDRCNLAKFRKTVVFGRGVLPADLLFIGEAPGNSEDLKGEAFIGPAGKLFDAAMCRASQMAGVPIPRFFITNVLACRPTDYYNGPNRPPLEWEAIRCSDRITTTFKDVKPKRVVLLGAVAATFLGKIYKDAVCLPHPSYLLRLGGQATPVFTGFARDLSEVFKGIQNG